MKERYGEPSKRDLGFGTIGRKPCRTTEERISRRKYKYYTREFYIVWKEVLRYRRRDEQKDIKVNIQRGSGKDFRFEFVK